MQNRSFLCTSILSTLCFLLPFWLLGQSGFRVGPGLVYGDTSQQHQLILDNYSRFLGTAISLQNNQLQFHIQGTQDTTVFKVASLRFLGLVNSASATTTDGSPETQEILAPTFSDPTYLRTAFPNKDKGRIRVINVIYGIAETNIGDNFQLGGGLLLPFGLLTTQRFGVKLLDQLYVGASNQMIFPLLFSAFDGEFFLFGDASINLSLGNEQRFLSLGRGLLYITQFGLETSQAYSLSAGGRVNDRLHLYGEVLLSNPEFGTTALLPSFSASFSTRQHRWRFGVFTYIDSGFTALWLPLLGYDYRF